MKKIIFGIFAHPDDEAFGPSGTLLMETRNGTELHLITLTAGEAGANPDQQSDLAAARLAEWRRAGELMGATSLHHLGYLDSQLTNTSLLEIAEKLESLVHHIMSSHSDDVTIEFMAFDLNGISGHIDHIVASRAACLAFYRLKQSDARFARLRLFCIPRTDIPVANTDWLYMEAGRTNAEITEVVDTTQLHDEIVEVIRAHHSQRGDGEGHIERLGSKLGLNHFMTLE